MAQIGENGRLKKSKCDVNDENVFLQGTIKSFYGIWKDRSKNILCFK